MISLPKNKKSFFDEKKNQKALTNESIIEMYNTPE